MNLMDILHTSLIVLTQVVLTPTGVELSRRDSRLAKMTRRFK